MSRNIIKSIIMVCVMAGIIFTPACSNLDGKPDNKDNKYNGTEVPIETEVPSVEPSENTGISENNDNQKNDKNNDNIKNNNNNNNDTVKGITSEKALDELNSLSEEEIDKLLKEIEDIDISDEINPDEDPGFDQIEIP